MKQKLLIYSLSFFLLLQLFFFVKDIYKQKNPIIIPGIEAAQITSSDFPVKKVTSNSSTEEKKVIDEDILFETNPYSDYYNQNSDYVGWLTFNETKIDYPVVRGQDNAFYLNHNFHKEEDLLGSIFMDYRNVGMGKDKHTILYGHYSKYGHMFADLEKLLNPEFMEANQTFTFKDPYTDRIYSIFSVHVSPAESEYIPVHFNDNEFSSFVSSLNDKSIYSLDVPVTESDKILTLVTCNYGIDNGRLYVNAVEITEQ